MEKILLNSSQLQLQLQHQLQNQSTQWIIASAIVLFCIYYNASSSKIPMMNAKSFFEFSDKRAIQFYQKNALDLVDGWFHNHPDTPGRVITEMGPIVVLPRSMADEIREDGRFSLRQQLAKVNDYIGLQKLYLLTLLDFSFSFTRV